MWCCPSLGLAGETGSAASSLGPIVATSQGSSASSLWAPQARLVLGPCPGALGGSGHLQLLQAQPVGRSWFQVTTDCCPAPPRATARLPHGG